MLLKNRKPSENGGIGSRIFDFCNILFMLCLAFITLYPMYNIFIVSISSAEYIYAGAVSFIPKGINFDAYRMVFKNDSIWRSFGNSILYTTVGTAINVVCSAMCAYPLSRKDFYGRGFFTLFVAVTMFISGGMIPTYLLVNHLRLVNTFAVMVIIGGVNVWNLTLCRNFFSTNIPAELRDAARIDGSSEFGIFFKIVLPISKAIVAVMVLYFAVSHWNGYHNALIYLREEAKYPLQLVLRNLLLQNTLSSETDAAGMSRLMDLQSMKYGVIVVASLPVMILYPFVQRYFVKGVMVGSVKG